MPKFRKKPVVIEARLLTLEDSDDIKAWCGGRTWSRPPMRAVTGISIPTLEGVMNAEYGDWIIKGVKGEFYPCKPDIFAATYSPEPSPSPENEERAVELLVTAARELCVTLTIGDGLVLTEPHHPSIGKNYRLQVHADREALGKALMPFISERKE